MNVLQDIGMVQDTMRLIPQQLMIARTSAISMKIVNILHMVMKMDTPQMTAMNPMVLGHTIAYLYIIMPFAVDFKILADGTFTTYSTPIGVSMAFPQKKVYAAVHLVEHAGGMVVSAEIQVP